MDCWRLIEDPPRPGPFNMAADQVLFESFWPGDPPKLRLYSWECPTLSLGRNEKLDEKIHIDFCRRKNIPVIRRMTGGKAVLHGFDLTYALVGDLQDERFCGGVIETYRFLARGFFEFFIRLGLEPSMVESSLPDRNEPHLCFTEPSAGEILIRGKKLIGNAQRVRGSASRGRVFLQHGSILLADPIPLMLSIFSHTNESILRRNILCLENLGVYHQQNQAELLSLLKETLAETFDVSWDQKPWMPNEEKEIEQCISNFRDLVNVEYEFKQKTQSEVHF